MAAPKGNKYAAGSSYNIEEEIKALDEWSRRDDALALCDYCVERDIYPQRVYEWRDKYEKYADVLKKTKMRMVARQRKKLRDKDNPYNYGLFMRELAHLDKFVQDAEREEKSFEADLKRKVDKEEKLDQAQTVRKAVAELLDERS